jgi:ABC-type uncharacterized transport system ATPase subunit
MANNNNQNTQLKEEMDYWVKEFESKISRTSEINTLAEENKQNIDYNYELIKELQSKILKLEKEIEEVKHFNHIAIKSRPLRELS